MPGPWRSFDVSWVSLESNVVILQHCLVLNTTEGSCFGWASVFKKYNPLKQIYFLLFLAELLHRIQESQTVFTLRQG